MIYGNPIFPFNSVSMLFRTHSFCLFCWPSFMRRFSTPPVTELSRDP